MRRPDCSCLTRYPEFDRATTGQILPDGARTVADGRPLSSQAWAGGLATHKWQAAGTTRQHGIYSLSHLLRLAYQDGHRYD